jgi:adenylate cyclase
MIQRLESLNREFARQGLPQIDIGVGINTGPATVGNFGSAERFQYAAIGDTTNTASRLEGLNKEYQTHIIVSEATKAQLTLTVKLKKLGDALVKGKTKPITVYEVRLPRAAKR